MDMAPITVNDEPINTKALVELMRYTNNVRLLLNWHGAGFFMVYVKYLHADGRVMVRQVMAQRKNPRTFKHAIRAIDWGKRIGCKDVVLTCDYSNHSELK